MGIAQAGVAFRPKTPITDMAAFISALFDESAAPISPPDIGSFDIRHDSDVMVEQYGDVYFIASDRLVWDFLENHQKDFSYLYQCLGSPDLALLYCHYDSGGSYGYAFIENGVRTRSRLQTTGVPDLPPNIECGEPKDFEKEWLDAQSYIEEDDCPIEERQRIFYKGDREEQVPESYLTAKLLYEALQINFSVCPWATETKPTYHFFKLTKKKKPWWKVW